MYTRLQRRKVNRKSYAAKEYVDEVIVVNDGSIDDTKEVALKAGARVIDHAVNLGYGAAISSCLKAGVHSQAEIIITLDADLQHNPEEIPLLIKPIVEGKADIVTGSRFVTGVEGGTLPTYRRFGITMLTKLPILWLKPQLVMLLQDLEPILITWLTTL